MTASRSGDKPAHNPYDLNALAKTWGEMIGLSADFARVLAEKSADQPPHGAGFDPFHLQEGYMALLERILEKPDRLSESQLALWQNYLSLWEATLTRLSGGQAPDTVDYDPSDRRFKSESWQKDALFAFIRQSYLLTARWIMQLVEQNSHSLAPHTADKVRFFTRQYVDALSPSNFAVTNPEVLKATIESGGQNLVRGMKNLLEDLRRGRMAMTDENAFRLGENIALTPGRVVFRNRLMELIHYTPAGKTTFETPLLVIPPWINKYYILDLRPDNSFVKWCVDQGHAVFVISWVNPDAGLKDVAFEDYMKDGILAALDAIAKQTGEKSANVIGYCIGGTLLTMTLAWLRAKKKAGRIRSATFLTTLIDFEHSGDLKIFVDEKQLADLRERMAKQGFMDAETLRSTFNLLRANELIWSFVVNNYLLGREPFPFDLLYWNSDSTNMPARMHEFYLRHFYLKNELCKPGKLSFGGVKMDVSTIDTPAFFLSTKDDHIAPWKATYEGAKLFSGPVRFTLAASGHIAGVVNPPAAGKYAHWVNDKLPKSPERWLAAARQEAGSWWPVWQDWVRAHAGPQVRAVDPARGPLGALDPAPGTYVKVRA